jgi:two-component system cell cycle sensor histidine kinase/response regulator CckA
LVAHAYDAMLDGGTLTITARESTAAEIAEAGLPPGDWVTLTFRDTGIGMPADVAKGAFDPLHAAAGIGRGPVPTLPSVRAIVSRHGGSVTLESSVGLGSVFAVRLPAAAPAVEPAPVPPPAESEPRRSLRLLVVDDEPANRTSLSRLLSFRGHEVLLAEDGPCAIRVAEDNKGKIDLVLLDLLMPGMNGKEVLTALRARCPDLKVMMVTGYAEQQLVDESLELGAVGVAYKPFEVEKLFEQVQRLGGGAVASHGRASPGGPAA